MQNADSLIGLIQQRKCEEALAMLNASPELARARSEKAGQMHGETPLHRAAHCNAVKLPAFD
jgi:hypothetical protein